MSRCHLWLGHHARVRTPTRAMTMPVKKPSSAGSEAEFLSHYQPGAYARPSVAVDIAILTIVDAELRVLLIERAEHPFKGAMALPGGFLRVGDGHRNQGEHLDAAAARELEEETGLKPADAYLEQLRAFGDAGRDPRMRVVTIAYYALIRPDLVASVQAGGDAVSANWHAVHALKPRELAFDHYAILSAAVARIAAEIDTAPIAASLVAKTFTIPELREVHAVLKGEAQDPGNFRRKFERMLQDGIVALAEGKRETVSKPAAVYRFVKPQQSRPARG
jgi:8-oxo-dGTP diphosphatase